MTRAEGKASSSRRREEATGHRPTRATGAGGRTALGERARTDGAKDSNSSSSSTGSGIGKQGTGAENGRSREKS